MFGIGMPEFLLILAVALIIIGPKKLPGLAKSLGKAMGEFKRATNDLKDTINVDPELQDVKRAFDDINTDIKDSFKDDGPIKSTSAPPDPDDGAPVDSMSSGSDSGDTLNDLGDAFNKMNTAENGTEPESPSDEPDAEKSTENTIDEKKSSEPDSNV